METLTVSNSKWQARTVGGVLQINFDTTYRGYKIQPVFNYGDGTSDFEVYKEGEETGTRFHAGTLAAVKRHIDEVISENPRVIIVKTLQVKAAIAGGYNLTKFDSPIMAALFADRFNGQILNA